MSTIKDVAKRSGVSIATVSRVINESEKVKPSTRKIVLKAIQELNYVPSAIAQGLQKKHTNTIGVIFPDATSYYFAEIIRGINNRVREEGYHIVVSSSHSAEDEAKTFLTLLKSRQVCGMIIMMPSIHNEEVLNSYIRDVPAILLNTEIETLESVTIVIDNYQGARGVTQHLVDHGHTKIGFIHGAPQNYDSQERYRGFLDALRVNGLKHSSSLESQGNFTENGGFQAALELLDKPVRPTAIFAANDAMAIGAIEAARQLSLQVPEEIAIVGFDDVSTAKYMSPPLTTVNVPVLKIGQIAGDHMIALLSGKASEEQRRKVVVPVTLIVRESCGCARKQNRENASGSGNA